MKFVEWTENGDIIVKLEADDLRDAICLNNPLAKLNFTDELIKLITEHAYDEEPEE